MKETEIIKHLIENKEQDHNISSIAKALNMDYKNIHNIITRLEKSNIIVITEFGNSKKIILNSKMHPLLFKAEFERKEQVLKNKDLKLIQEHLEQINFPYIMLLFGSYVKGTKTKHSDIDLLAISENETKINSVLSIIPLNIHLTVLKSTDFISMAKSKEFSVVSEALKKNIILIGIDEYYRLMQNVR